MSSESVARAIDRNFTSPNELDQNMEQANIVDALYDIARALRQVARALEKLNAVD